MLNRNATSRATFSEYGLQSPSARIKTCLFSTFYLLSHLEQIHFLLGITFLIFEIVYWEFHTRLQIFNLLIRNTQPIKINCIMMVIILITVILDYPWPHFEHINLEFIFSQISQGHISSKSQKKKSTSKHLTLNTVILLTGPICPRVKDLIK